MTLFQQLEKATKEAVKSIFSIELEQVEITLTRKDQNGDYTIMVFPMLRHIKGNPAAIGEQIGTYLKEKTDLITAIEVIKGFLNISVSSTAFLIDFNRILNHEKYGTTEVRLRVVKSIKHRSSTIAVFIFVNPCWLGSNMQMERHQNLQV